VVLLIIDSAPGHVIFKESRVRVMRNAKHLHSKEEDVKELTQEYMGWSNTPQSKSVRDTIMQRIEWKCFCSIWLKAKTLV